MDRPGPKPILGAVFAVAGVIWRYNSKSQASIPQNVSNLTAPLVENSAVSAITRAAYPLPTDICGIYKPLTHAFCSPIESPIPATLEQVTIKIDDKSVWSDSELPGDQLLALMMGVLVPLLEPLICSAAMLRNLRATRARSTFTLISSALRLIIPAAGRWLGFPLPLTLVYWLLELILTYSLAAFANPMAHKPADSPLVPELAAEVQALRNQHDKSLGDWTAWRIRDNETIEALKMQVKQALEDKDAANHAEEEATANATMYESRLVKLKRVGVTLNIKTAELKRMQMKTEKAEKKLHDLDLQRTMSMKNPVQDVQDTDENRTGQTEAQAEQLHKGVKQLGRSAKTIAALQIKVEQLGQELDTSNSKLLDMLHLVERLAFAGMELREQGFRWYREANDLAAQLDAKDSEINAGADAIKTKDQGISRWNAQAVGQKQTRLNANEVSSQLHGDAGDDADIKRLFSRSLTAQGVELLPFPSAPDPPKLHTGSKSQPLFSQSDLEAFAQDLPPSASENSKASPCNISLNSTSITMELPDDAALRQSNEPRSAANIADTNDKATSDDEQKPDNYSSPLRALSEQHTTALAPSSGSPSGPHKVDAHASAQPDQDSTVTSVEVTKAENAIGQKSKQALPPSFAPSGSSFNYSCEPGPALSVRSSNNYVDPIFKYGAKLDVQDTPSPEENDPIQPAKKTNISAPRPKPRENMYSRRKKPASATRGYQFPDHQNSFDLSVPFARFGEFTSENKSTSVSSNPDTVDGTDHFADGMVPAMALKPVTATAAHDASPGVETKESSRSLVQRDQGATAASSNPVTSTTKVPARWKTNIGAFKACDRDFVALSWPELRQAARDSMKLSSAEAKGRHKAALIAQAVEGPDDAMSEELVENPTLDVEVQYNKDARFRKRVAQNFLVEQGKMDLEDCEDYEDSDDEHGAGRTSPNSQHNNTG